MAIKKVRVANFKSFKNLEVELGNLNILIGANASGKSNFIQIFKFLRDIRQSGLVNAISMQGGVEYLRNINIGSSEAFSLEVVSDQQSGSEQFGFVTEVNKKLIGTKTRETTYRFIIEFNKKGPGFKIVEDKLIYKCGFVELERRKNGLKEKGVITPGEIVLSNAGGKLNIKLLLEELPIKQHDILPTSLEGIKLRPKLLLLETPFAFVLPPMPPSVEYAVFGDVSIYDFDPKLPKKATPITGKADLEEDGSNLAIVLKNVIENKDKRREFSNLLTYLLPFVDDLDVERFADKSILFKLRETYSDKEYLPASLISDGTIDITALIIALFFGKKSLAIVEEPERNIHPHLISKVVSMMKDASRNKQIIVTTHNPEVIKHAKLEDILLVFRDEEGFSSISRPSEKDKVKIFLENEIGIDELYVDNLLEI